MLALILFAQEQAPAGGAGGMGGWSSLITLWLPLLAIFYFLMIRPAQRQEKQRKAMIAALKKGDRVIAAGGLMGTVYAFRENEDEVTLKVDEGRLKVLRSSIMRVIRDEEARTDAKAEAKSS